MPRMGAYGGEGGRRSLRESLLSGGWEESKSVE